MTEEEVRVLICSFREGRLLWLEQEGLPCCLWD